MNVTLLAISIGNTNVRMGSFVDGKLTQTQLVHTHDAEALHVMVQAAWDAIRDHPGAAIVVATVNPKPTEFLTTWIKETLKVRPLRVEQDIKIPIGRQLDRETIVGDDRLLNAAAAYDTLKQACVVIDSGTAITIDFVDGVGTFHGGAIGPGARMMLNSLHDTTAQLPEIELSRPLEPVGHNTAEAMRSGVYYGLRGMARELIEQYAQIAGAWPLAVATGGDAKLLFEDWELIDRIVPDLTLQGIAITLQASRDADNADE